MTNPYDHIVRKTLAHLQSQYLAKGKAPLGAAFARARRLQRENGGDHEDNVRRANDYLRSKGHGPIKKGLLDRFRALTPEERADQGILQERGFSKEEARALAMAGTGRIRKAAAVGYHQAYVQEAARLLPASLHKSLHRIARARAGGYAKAQTISDAEMTAAAQASENAVSRAWNKVDPGAVAKGGPALSELDAGGAPRGSKLKFQVKIASDDLVPPKGVQSACRRGLELAPKHGGSGLTEGAKSRARSMADGNAVTAQTVKRMAAFFARHESDKKAGWSSPPTPGYVAWLLWGGDAGQSWANSVAKRVDKSSLRQVVQKRCTADDDLLTAVLATPVQKDADTLLRAAMSAPDADPYRVDEGVTATPAYARLWNAQELVSRMDAARAADSGLSVEQARQRASDGMARQGSTDGKPPVGSNSSGNQVGLRVDLDAGANREPGFLSLDTYAHDYGTILHDVEMGLPLPDASAGAVRACGPLWQRPSLSEDPVPMLTEIQRILCQGGLLTYEGPQLTDDQLGELPGLRVQSREMLGNGQERMQAKRMLAWLPNVYGADPAMLSTRERRAGDIAQAQAEFGLKPPPASVAMANLLTKADTPVETFDSRVIKKDSWEQIVYGVVLAPDEEDSQGDKISAEEIQRTAHRFLESRLIGQEHLGPMDGATVVESYLAPQDLAFAGAPGGAQMVPKGSWVMGVHIADAEKWQMVLDDEFTGFSVGGYGDRMPRAD